MTATAAMPDADSPVALTEVSRKNGESPPGHVVVDPSILYFGTPVVLVSTLSRSGAGNLMPMSSAFWLGKTGLLGIGARSQTCQNLLETDECVLNLPSANLVSHVNRLALTTGRYPVPDGKAEVGYQHVADKFAHAGLTRVPSGLVAPPRVAECPVNLEARVVARYPLENDNPEQAGGSFAFEVSVIRVHVHPAIRMRGTAHRIDPDAWRPLIMSFQQFYTLGPRLDPSRLATIDEEWYR